ncbi:hypothetical protein [Microvirga calopogonii]|uniref:hypothetical protein n=1 Tax=Microvirga calopogonii TaxID=2078013 RepID=UPI000E0DA668|nr:hypothetical protein [Microvirga calopogonii]
MRSNIIVKSSRDTPRQAWLSRLKGSTLELVNGAGVRCHSDWFFEGGWAGTDSPRSLRADGIYLGSGGVWDGDSLSLIAPSHTAEAVYVAITPDALFASNSLPFVLTGAGVTEFESSSIRSKLETLVQGLDRYRRDIYETPHLRLYRYFNAIIQCREGSEPRESIQDSDLSGVTSFETYRRFLLSIIRQASDTYGSKGISVYLSTGYDSTACAALAKQVDRDCLAITINNARSGHADAGIEAARALGMRAETLSRQDRSRSAEKGDGGRESVTDSDIDRLSDFYIGMGVLDECLHAPDELLAGRTVLTGFHGDKIWDPSLHPSTTLKRGDSSGASIGEFRLRVGFLHIPVPMLGFKAHPLLQAIGLSDEMRPWRSGRILQIRSLAINIPVLGLKTHPLLQRFWDSRWLPRKVRQWRYRGTYDRPIPRRIAEEAGVPRSVFGQKKLAAATLAQGLDSIEADLFRRSLSRYQRSLDRLRAASDSDRAVREHEATLKLSDSP